MAMASGTDARVLVYNVVVGWLAAHVNRTPQQIDVMRTFGGAPPAGYNQTRGAFFTMCDDIAAAIQHASGRSVSLPTNWRLEHQGDTIGAFINAVAVRLISAPMTGAGRAALAWAMER